MRFDAPRPHLSSLQLVPITPIAIHAAMQMDVNGAEQATAIQTNLLAAAAPSLSLVNPTAPKDNLAIPVLIFPDVDGAPINKVASIRPMLHV